MTLCAFAAFTAAMENPKMIAAVVNHETKELRISVPIGVPGKGAVSAYREGARSAKPIYPVFRPSFACRQPAGTIRLCRSRAGGLLDAITRNWRRFTFGCAAWRGAQILHWPRRDLLKLLRRVHRPVGIAQHLAR
jgi:hypothetical protein